MYYPCSSISVSMPEGQILEISKDAVSDSKVNGISLRKFSWEQ